jgi:transglutaminase-like putative cysteine protease
MQRLERLLSTNMAILAVIGAAMLGLGQQDVKLVLLVLVGAVTSVVYNDRRQVFHLNHHLANVAALCAVALAMIDYSASDRNQQLLAIANLLVYLQVVVFFQEKNARIYGQLAMLSLLQVVVAAALNYSIFFGFLAVAYLGVGLPTLSLYFFYREMSRFVPAAAASLDESHSASGGGVLVTAASASRGREKSTPPRRWPLSSEVASFTGSDFKQQEAAFGRRGLLAFTMRIAGFTILLAIFIFIFAPRFGRTPWQTATLEAASIVGYSEEVTLGELGSAMENPETVMRVTFVDEETERPLHLVGSPLFRGTVVSHYDLKHRRWSRFREGYDPQLLRRVNKSARNLVRQEITLEPLSEPTAFAIFPVSSDDPEHCIIRYDDTTKQLYREERDRNQQITFNLWTTGIENMRQSRLLPAGNGLSGAEQNALRRIPRGEGGTDSFAGLKQVADEAIAAAEIDEDNPYLVAKTLEAFMLSHGGFKYSIEGQERPNNEVDPIEDFVTRSRVGHCEYFASALTLMLRHRGIPSRVVIGFKGGDWNSLGKYYQVRQLHAHAWVEAYFTGSQLKRQNITLGPNNFAAWLTLDSTADTLADTPESEDGLWAKTLSLADYVQMQWITYVVGLTREQQQEHIYQPLSAAYEKVVQKLAPAEEAATENNTYAQVYAFLTRIVGSNWVSWRGLLVTIALLVLLAGIFILLSHVARRLWRWSQRRFRWGKVGKLAAETPEVAFYRQLETLLARYGYNRSPAQTQREFATAAGRRLSLQEQTHVAALLPREVVDAFYAVRFGGRTLDGKQLQAVERALAELKVRLTGEAGASARAGSNDL